MGRFRLRMGGSILSRSVFPWSMLACSILLAGCGELRLPDGRVTHVAFGDSTTAGPSNRDYPDILREMLGEPPEAFANEGEGGETTAEGNDRLDRLIASAIYPNAAVWMYWEGGGDVIDFIQDNDPFLLLSPEDADFPLAGTLEDRLDQTQANIQRAIASMSGAGHTVLVATLFFIREDVGACPALPLDILLPAQAANANAYLRLLNERIRTAATSAGAILVDIAAVDETLGASAENYFNCNHLSEAGNTIAAGVFRDALAGN